MKFYRYEIIQYASRDHNGEYCSPNFPNPHLTLNEYELFKETPKGYWISYGHINGIKSFDKWVSKTSRKRFAYPTKEEALIGFIKRNERRIRIIQWQIDTCKIAVDLANALLSKEQNAQVSDTTKVS